LGKTMKLIVPIVVSLLIGFGLGSIPFLNQYLHWNLWFIIPVSGLALGMGLGWTQFFGCYLLNQRLNGWRIVVLALAASASYLAIDFGIYRSTSIPVNGVNGMPGGSYRLAELVSFPQYMRWRLGSSSVTTSQGAKIIEMGAAGTTLSFVIDVVGAFVGAGGMLVVAVSMYPYCARCGRFKSRAKIHVLTFHYEEKRVQEILAQLAAHEHSGSGAEFVAYLEELSRQIDRKEGDTRITADQRYCGVCGEVTVVGSFARRAKDAAWVDVPEMAFTLTSLPRGENTPAEA
jgi:hypothetical protein